MDLFYLLYEDTIVNNQIWNLPASIAKAVELTGNDKVLYSYLRTCPEITETPNVRTMSVDCGVDHTTTLKAIKNLEQYGLIKVKRSNAEKLPRLLDIKVFKKATLTKSAPKRKAAKKVVSKKRKTATKRRARR